MVNAPDEAVAFDPASIAVEPIRADEEYAGVRVMFEARLGTIRDRLQVDVGFGDALWPHAEELAYPVALGEAAPILRAYRPETVRGDVFFVRDEPFRRVLFERDAT